MFSAKLFNKFTLILAAMFFLSVIISTVADIQNDNYIQFEFNQLLEEVESFNANHLSSIDSSNIETIYPVDQEYAHYTSGKQALINSFSNLDNATSYYNEAYGTLSTSILGVALDIDMSFVMARYENGNMVYQIVARETSNNFGGKMGAIMFYYDKVTNKIYHNSTWTLENANGVWNPVYSSTSWKTKTIEEFIANYWGEPDSPLFKINNATTIEEVFFKQISSQDESENGQYHVQYKLHPILSTGVYGKFITEALNTIEPDLVRDLNFKEVIMSAIISKYGELQTMKLKQNLDFVIYIRKYNVVFTKNCNFNMTYMYSLYNQPIPFEVPTIPGL
ncbi:MAG: hypothetical protein AB7S44_02855 [Spirochaetales bacterium]